MPTPSAVVDPRCFSAPSPEFPCVTSNTVLHEEGGWLAYIDLDTGLGTPKRIISQLVRSGDDARDYREAVRFEKGVAECLRAHLYAPLNAAYFAARPAPAPEFRIAYMAVPATTYPRRRKAA